MDTDTVSGVDYSSIEGIQRKRVLKFVNHFIVQMTNFLSNFSQTCDIKLLTLANKLQNLETSLVLLENKLESIPQLKVVHSETKTIPQTVVTEAQNEELNDTITHEKVVKKTEENMEEKVLVDPQIKVFVKMLNVGVPEQAVRLKMQSQGLDDHLLDSFILTKKM